MTLPAIVCGYRSSDPGENYAAGGSGVKSLEALAYLRFADPGMANYETLKQVSCWYKIQCAPSKTSAEAATLSADNIIVYFTESKSHV